MEPPEDPPDPFDVLAFIAIIVVIIFAILIIFVIVVGVVRGDLNPTGVATMLGGAITTIITILFTRSGRKDKER